ncbi:MAG: PTS glucose transporter subunit IIA [Ruminococcaceae bacterium]|nr:PTS glucose transporter subunit IIA [Oscillospiraceae bacterium]
MKQTREHAETLCAPGSGTVRRLGGASYAIDFFDEENGDVVSPVGGVVTHIGRGGNRISICSNGGTEVSVGIGEAHPGRQNTAEGCHFYVQEGQAVNAGERLMHAQLSRIRRLGGSSACVMTLEGTDGVRQTIGAADVVRAGVTPLLRVVHDGENLEEMAQNP